MVAVREARRERLTGGDAPEFRAVLNEAVIRRVVGGGLMREQLIHIAELAELPHISVQLLPFGAGAHPAMDGSFSILGFAEVTDPAVVYLESQTGSLYLEQEREVERYTQIFSHLVTRALDPGESRRLIARAAKDLAE
jgi:hypothetical protein